jgi:hypothetical protein
MTSSAVAVNLLDTCRESGIDLYLDGEDFRFRGPRRAMTRELREALATHRADLMALLRRLPAPTPSAPVERFKPSYLPCVCPAGRCWRCCNRPCERCGRPTGSAFIRTCIACGFLPDPE